MAKRILPPQEYLRECFDYNPETGIAIWRHRPEHHFSSSTVQRQFNTRWAGVKAGCAKVDDSGHCAIYLAINQQRFLLHRAIWKWMTGEDLPGLIDHRDRNSLNNRWCNLRAATTNENAQNGHKRGANLKGATRSGSKWKAQITVNRRKIWLGSFSTEEEAHEAYCRAAAFHHGAFASFGYD